MNSQVKNFINFAVSRYQFSVENYPISPSGFLPTCTFGVYEKLEEVLKVARTNTSTRKEVILEVGDVLTYLSICCVIHNFSDSEYEQIVKTQGEFFAEYKPEYLQELGKNLIFESLGLQKRVFRNDFDRKKLVENFKDIFTLCVMFLSTNKAKVNYCLEAVIEKLDKRKQKSTLLGEGSNR